MQWRDRIISRTPEEFRADFAGVYRNWMEFPENDDPNRKGCVGTVLDDGTGDLAMPQVYLGIIAVGKSAVYAFYSLEKGIRVGEHPEHVTSAASALAPEENATRGATDKKYAGATRAKGFLRFSHSGYTGVGDQCCSAAMQDRAGLLNDAMLEQIERESGSDLTRRFVLYDRDLRDADDCSLDGEIRSDEKCPDCGGELNELEDDRSCLNCGRSVPRSA